MTIREGRRLHKSLSLAHRPQSPAAIVMSSRQDCVSDDRQTQHPLQSTDDHSSFNYDLCTELRLQNELSCAIFISDERDENATDQMSLDTLDTSVTNTQTSGWYEIDRILRCRRINGKRSYLVRWKNSWVEHQDVSDPALKSYYGTPDRRRRQRR